MKGNRSKHRVCRSAVLFIGLSLFVVSPIVYGALDAPAREVGQPASGQSLGIASVPSLRDLGGYTTETGTTVAKGLVYRSNQLSEIKPDDMKRLEELYLKAAYDLRTAEEKEKRPDELPPGVAYVWLNVLADSPQAGPAQLEPLLKEKDGSVSTISNPRGHIRSSQNARKPLRNLQLATACRTARSSYSPACMARMKCFG